MILMLTIESEYFPGNITELVINELKDEVVFALVLILFVAICSANSITILVFWRTAVLRTLANTYVVSLAAVDFLIGLSLVPMSLFMLPTTRASVFNRYTHLCIFINGFNVGMTANSVLHMTIISVERYLYIVKPYLYERLVSVRSVISSIATSWAVGLAYALVPHFDFHANTTACNAKRLLPTWYLFHLSWASYFTSAMIILVMYSLVIRTARRQHRRIAAGQLVGPSNARIPREGLSKSALKSIKFFVSVFGAFFTCFTPIVLCMGLDYLIDVPTWLYHNLTLLALLNSGMNFVILMSQNRQYRDQLKLMFRYICFKSRHKNQRNSR